MVRVIISPEQVAYTDGLSCSNAFFVIFESNPEVSIEILGRLP